MTSIFRPARTVSCHAWSPDGSRLALCPNSSEVWVYGNCKDKDVKNWKREAVLAEHDLVVSAIDWCAATGRLLTVSHDRNAFVWTEEGEGKWTPTISILRINRAATCGRWSPDGKKFAVGSSTKTVPICYYEEANNWWVSVPSKKHKSTITDVAWHPNSQLVATACTDFRCRLIYAWMEVVDGPARDGGPLGVEAVGAAATGDVLLEFDQCRAWINAVAWSPSGLALAFAGQDSSLQIAAWDGPGAAPTLERVRCKTLPDNSLTWVSDDVVVGGGHDMNPHVYRRGSDGAWSRSESLDKKKDAKAGHTAGGGGSFASARAMFAAKTTRGESGPAKGGGIKTKHQAAISEVRLLADGRISSAGLDGRIAVWDAVK